MEAKKKGGLITMPFIFANEIAEKLAVVGFSTNMISYLTEQLHLPLAKAATTLTNFNGTASMTPLIGAFIADAYAGRFWTISVASFIYTIGMTSLTISAVLPQLRPPPCDIGTETCKEASTMQLGILYTSLLLCSIGAGGIRPCVVAFGADQFDESDPSERTKTWNFFNWYYFFMGLSMLLAVTVVVYIQDNVGWGLGLGIPVIAMAVSVVTFIGGYSMYRRLDPAGSPFARLAHVVVAAVRKRKMQLDDDPRLLYENDELDAPISVAGKLIHTKQLRFLDRAAIITEEDEPNKDQTKQPNLWRLNTVHRVEELKQLIRMAPIWAAGILVITAFSQQNTFSLQQARTMDRRITNHSTFKIPPGSMSVFNLLSMLLTITLYDRILMPLARRITGIDRGISFLHRMGIGFAVSVFATLIAGFVEVKRKHVAAQHGLLEQAGITVPISVFWLVPQYAFNGIAEAFQAIGHLEFFYDQMPESMRSTGTALYWLSISAGNYVSTMLISLVHKYSAGPGGSNWLPDNLNKGKLNYFYWIVSAIQAVNLMYYIVCVNLYTYKPVQLRREQQKDPEDH